MSHELVSRSFLNVFESYSTFDIICGELVVIRPGLGSQLRKGSLLNLYICFEYLSYIQSVCLFSDKEIFIRVLISTGRSTHGNRAGDPYFEPYSD